MKDHLSLMFIDAYPFFKERNIKLVDALKITDILILRMEVDVLNTEEFTSYLTTFITLSNLLRDFFNLDDKESGVFNIAKLEALRDIKEEQREKFLGEFKKKRIEIYQKYAADLIDLIDKLEESNLQAAA